MTSSRVLCICLGGTKLQFGGLMDGRFESSDEIHWRSTGPFSHLAADEVSLPFTRTLVAHASQFLERMGLNFGDISIIGIPFPGPCRDGRWYSNNLIAAFRKGVPLEAELRDTLRAAGQPVPTIRVVLDAKADGGGELYHPNGAVSALAERAMVLNLATGIAAGFICRGTVLVTDEEFRQHVGKAFDEGAGQLGRHLWFDEKRGSWDYRFARNGGMPSDRSGQRFTDRLSGPALAGRLFTLIRRLDGTLVNNEKVASIVRSLEGVSSSELPIVIRAAPRETVTTLLGFADEMMDRDDSVGAAMTGFCDEVATEFAQAIACWLGAPGWDKFGERIVLTGGVGIHFFEKHSRFLDTIRQELPGVFVVRSRLTDAAEREAFFFQGKYGGLSS